MKKVEQKQRTQNQSVTPVVNNNGSMSNRKRTFNRLNSNKSTKSKTYVEMRDLGNTAAKYQKQGLGGYDDEENEGDYSEVSLDNSGRKN